MATAQKRRKGETAKGPTKASRIRDALTRQPNASNGEIIAALAAEGITVSSQMISTNRTKLRKGPKRKKHKLNGENGHHEAMGRRYTLDEIKDAYQLVNSLKDVTNLN